jgi:hypothetical protein
MSNFEVYDADMHDFYIRYLLIDIRYLIVAKTGFYPVSRIVYRVVNMSKAD